MWSETCPGEKRDLVVQRIRQEEEEDRRTKAIGFAGQGQWTNWNQALERPVPWKDLWVTDQGKLSFLLRAVADLLPTPQNLKIWGKEGSSICMQCGAEFCTLNHILTGCSKALAEGRYKWRHDKVLREVAKWTDLQRMKANTQQPITSGFINFKRAGKNKKK